MKKAAIEMEEIVKLIIVLIVLLAIIAAIWLLKGKADLILDKFKTIFIR